ncbi:MAG: DUF2254 domain-containing protein [Actinomycetaceae bacterium]|nr:DUF2254 domain-containing protein [Actinomycetaceae bacterium]MBS6365134.1 DUF2254 domain-containing protein [Actinomycetaceae bacterium]
MVENPIYPQVKRDENGRLLVWAVARELEEIIDDFCGEIRRNGSDEPLVVISLLQVLESVYSVADQKHQALRCQAAEANHCGC